MDNLNKYLRAALENRLSLVRDAAAKLATKERAPTPPADDPEEALRVIMVKLWPKITRNEFDGQDMELFFELLHSIAGVAASSDLRFLDAWNNAWETLSTMNWGDADAETLFAPFAKKYEELLTSHLDTY